MPATIDFRDLPRFLACPGSALMQDKADLILGPVERTEAGQELTLEPFLPISGLADVLPEDGKLTVQISGVEDPQALTAAALAGHGKYDFLHDFKEYELQSDGKTVALFDLETIKSAGNSLQQQFRAAQQSGELLPGEACKTCPAAVVCPAVTETIKSVTRLDNCKKEQAAEWAELLELVNEWTDKAQTALQGIIATGTKVPGHKLAKGRRVWKNEDEALKYFKRNVKKATTLLTDKRLKSPDEVDELLKDAEFNRPIPDDKLRELTVTLPGELVRESTQENEDVV